MDYLSESLWCSMMIKSRCNGPRSYSQTFTCSRKLYFVCFSTHTVESRKLYFVCFSTDTVLRNQKWQKKTTTTTGPTFYLEYQSVCTPSTLVTDVFLFVITISLRNGDSSTVKQSGLTPIKLLTRGSYY